MNVLWGGIRPGYLGPSCSNLRNRRHMVQALGFGSSFSAPKEATLLNTYILFWGGSYYDYTYYSPKPYSNYEGNYIKSTRKDLTVKAFRQPALIAARAPKYRVLVFMSEGRFLCVQTTCF